jgi:glycosyltransferase involved in cell wall biosynthesis
MLIAHIAAIHPHRTGLYGTARDIVKAERALGHDARLVDPTKPREGEVDGVRVSGHQWACKADAWVSHSGLRKHLQSDGHPTVMMLHGRPYSSYLLGLLDKTHVYDHVLTIVKQDDYKAFVTLWAEFLPYWKHLVPNGALRALNAPVSLDEWTPDGPSGYGFHDKGGAINVVIADQWREDKNPHECIHAFSIYADMVKGARLHIYGAPVKDKGFPCILRPLAKRGVLGEAQGFVKGLDNVYRAADVLITPHRIATRTVREALACGCQVVMAPGNDYTPYTAEPHDIEAFAKQIDIAVGLAKTHPDERREANRASATKHFDPAHTAQGLIDILSDSKDETDA